MAGWMALESDPVALNKFIRSLGIPDPWEFVEIQDFAEDWLGFIPQPVAALVFCFPTIETNETRISEAYKALKDSGYQSSEELFFMKQPKSIGSACGTYSTLHALANSEIIDKGSGLFHAFFNKAKDASPIEKSKILQSDAQIATAHQACASAGSTDPSRVTHHYIAYIPFKGQLMEFDSCQDFARPVGDTTMETFLWDVAKICRDTMSQDPSSAFNALALVGSRFD